MQTINDYSPARMADRAEILDLEYRWCRAIDRRDYASMPALFHPDAHDDHGAYCGGIPGFVDWLEARHRDIVFSMHQMTNVHVEFAGADNALVELYLAVVQRSPAPVISSAPLAGTDQAFVDLISRSRYVDRVQRRDGAWKILRRTFIPEWRRIDESSVPAAPNPNAQKGLRSLDDFVFAERRAMGIAA